MNRLNVWAYWAGPRPRWIDTCLNSFSRCCRRSDFHLLTPENVQGLSLGLPDRWKSLPPGVGTDCLRAALLARYGGLWVDADTVCLKDPASLLEVYQPSQFLFSTWDKMPYRAIAGYVYAPKGHRIAMRWHENVVSALKWSENIGWGDLGETALTPIVRQSPSIQSCYLMPRGTFLPIDIDSDVEMLFDKRDWQERVGPGTVAFGLNHSWMMEHRREIMEADPEGSPILIHRLLADSVKGITS
jgi:hypothetical protein